MVCAYWTLHRSYKGFASCFILTVLRVFVDKDLLLPGAPSLGSPDTPQHVPTGTTHKTPSCLYYLHYSIYYCWLPNIYYCHFTSITAILMLRANLIKRNSLKICDKTYHWKRVFSVLRHTSSNKYRKTSKDSITKNPSK